MRRFTDVKLKTNKQTWSNRGIPLRQLRAEHNSKIFYSNAVTKRQLKKSKPMIRRNVDIDADEIRSDDVEDLKKLEDTNGVPSEDVDELNETTNALNIDERNGEANGIQQMDNVSGQT